MALLIHEDEALSELVPLLKRLQQVPDKNQNTALSRKEPASALLLGFLASNLIIKFLLLTNHQLVTFCHSSSIRLTSSEFAESLQILPLMSKRFQVN